MHSPWVAVQAVGMQEVVYKQSYVTYSPVEFPLRVITFVVSAIEFLLALRLILVALGANSSAQFVAWIYSVTGSLIAPFSGAFPNLSLGGFVLELSTLFAMIGYALIGWVVIRLISAVSPSGR